MMRVVSQRLCSAARGFIQSRPLLGQPGVATQSQRLMSSHGVVETDEQFDARYVAYFSRPEIDGWEIRHAMTELNGMDLIPEPKIIIAALHACRRVNDYALTTRFLEMLKFKATAAHKDVYPYIMQEVRPTLDELGISTIEEMGYDKPELALESVFEMISKPIK